MTHPNPVARPDLVPGYALTRCIGRGSSSTVWEARQLSTGRTVAVKVLEEDVLGETARRFDRERQAMGTLASLPHVVTIIDAGVNAGHPWIAMDLYRCGSLARLPATGRTLTPEDAAGVLSAMAHALDALHSRGLLHCDVKPANIMIDDRGAPALTDFGVARSSQARATTTTTSGYTLDHVAPEVLDEHTPTAAADIYSLGTTLWELLAGHPPFRHGVGSSPATVIRRILEGRAADLPRDDVPADLAALIEQMMQVDPAQRPATMADVAARIDAIREGHGWTAPTALAVTDGPEGPTMDPERIEPDAYAVAGGEATQMRRVRSLPEVHDGGPLPDPERGRWSRRHRRLSVALAVAATVLLLAGTGTAVALHSAAGSGDAAAAPVADTSPSSQASLPDATAPPAPPSAPVVAGGPGAVAVKPATVAEPPTTGRGPAASGPVGSGAGSGSTGSGSTGSGSTGSGSTGSGSTGSGSTGSGKQVTTTTPAAPTRSTRTTSVVLQNPRTASTAQVQWVVGTFAFDQGTPRGISSVCVTVELSGDVLDTGEEIDFAIGGVTYGGHIGGQTPQSSVTLCTNGANASDQQIFNALASSGGVGSLTLKPARDSGTGPATYTVASATVSVTALWS